MDCPRCGRRKKGWRAEASSIHCALCERFLMKPLHRGVAVEVAHLDVQRDMDLAHAGFNIYPGVQGQVVAHSKNNPGHVDVKLATGDKVAFHHTEVRCIL